MEEFVKEKVEEELKAISISKRRDMTKTAKDVIDTLLPEIAKVITVSVTAAMTTVMDRITEVVKSQAAVSFSLQRQALLMKYECDRLEQYQRSDNLLIYGIEEESEESEEALEEKVVELASNMGVNLQADDISVVHRLGKPQDRERPVIVRLCRRKKRNAILRKKAELKKKDIRVFVNEDLTPLRSAMRRMVKEQVSVKNVTTRNGKILAWLTDEPNRAIEINTPDELIKVGIVTPDWKRLHMDHIVWENNV
ncbi:hypothetical protein Pmani_008340 [Petrolisthes manimaculis]|uniref:Uncharacterized protein n=1 Tax=Petrolisthes manimaculis TaxID=1843537 RepID=A0AAE1Q6Y9_9EUCA|nr:hypothetical protein Pmani_008340 [Petrolisthes manimaculis]